MAVKIQIRRDTASNWSANNPVLSIAELGIETDSNKIKIGNGSSAWNSLSYANALPSELVTASASLYSIILSASTTLNTNSLSYATSASAHSFNVSKSYVDALDTSATALIFASSASANANVRAIGHASSASATAFDFSRNYTDSSISSASTFIVSSIVASAPETLNTLNELALALNNDASFASTVTNSLSTKLNIASASATYATINQLSSASANVNTLALGYATSASANANVLSQARDNLKADLASPALTGTPTAPTAAAGTNTTQIATTAFSFAAASSASANVNVLALSYATSASANANAFSQARDNLKADLASPTFTGTVTSPHITLSGNQAINSFRARNVYIDTGTPSGGNDGDLWIRYI